MKIYKVGGAVRDSLLEVGIGTKIGSGCTSGHGVSGISRLSIRSIIATMLFIFSAIITVLLFNYVGLN